MINLCPNDGRPVHGRGLCSTCYTRARRQSKPSPLPRFDADELNYLINAGVGWGPICQAFGYNDRTGPVNIERQLGRLGRHDLAVVWRRQFRDHDGSQKVAA